MRPTLRILALVACLLLGLALPALAVGGVYDNAHMFSAGTVSQLNSEIMAIRGNYNKDVYVITSPGGEGSWPAVAQKYTGGPNIDGVVIFIDQAAHKTYVALDNRTAEVINKDALKGSINDRFRQHDFDGGIQAGLGYVQNTFASHSPARRGQAPPAFAPQPVSQSTARSSGRSGFGLVFFFLFLIVGFLILVGIVRAIFRGIAGVAGPMMGGGGNVGPGYGPQYGPGYGPPQQGGGFMSSFLGGAGGAIAGNALYDHFEHRSGNAGYMPPVEPGGGGFAPAAPDFQQPGTSTDWSDSGSSFGGGGSDSSSWSGDSGSSWDSGSGGGGGGGSDWS
ncbi:MAG TPA: TPM domain-containing protein [Candidatus Xenobia bacterium]